MTPAFPPVVRCCAALLALTLAAPGAALAQQREGKALSSDRPGLGDGAHVLGAGVAQVEAGGTIDAAAADEYFTASALVRVGVEAFELRLFLPSGVVRQDGENFQVGDLAVGAKLPLPPTAGWRWALGGALTLPTGSDGISANDEGLGASLIGERPLGGGAALAVNLGYGFLFDGVGDGTLSLIVTPSFPVPGVEGLSAYVGYAGFIRPGDDAHLAEWGIAKSLDADTQWDVNAGFDPDAHTWFLGAGVSRRWR